MNPQTSELLKNINAEIDRISSVIRPSIQFQLLHPDAKPPYKAYEAAAGYDLVCTHAVMIRRDVLVCYTNVAIGFPPGKYGLLRERSSARKMGLNLIGGVIDPDFTGGIEVSFKVDIHSDLYEPGQRCAQLLLLPVEDYAMVQVDKLPESERGARGFGSSGR